MKDHKVEITSIAGAAIAAPAIILQSMNLMIGGVKDEIRPVRRDVAGRLRSVRE